MKTVSNLKILCIKSKKRKSYLVQQANRKHLALYNDFILWDAVNATQVRFII